MKRIVIAVAAMALAALAACSPPPEAPPLARPAESIQRDHGLVIDGEQIASPELWVQAQAEGQITLYSGYTQDSEETLLEQFESDTGLKVKLIRLTPNRLYERIVAEFGAGKLGADVVRISDAGFVTGLSKRGVFQPYQPPTATNLREDVEFDGGKYYRTFDPIYTFGYNTALIKGDAAPTTWKDLLQERWSNKLGIAQAGAGGSALALTRFQRDVLGDDYLREYAGNARVFDSLGAELDGLARGEIEAGTVVVSSVNIAVNENAPVAFVVPAEGVTAYDYYTGLAFTASGQKLSLMLMYPAVNVVTDRKQRGRNVTVEARPAGLQRYGRVLRAIRHHRANNPWHPATRLQRSPRPPDHPRGSHRQRR